MIDNQKTNANNYWHSFLNQVRDFVDDALVIHKGGNDIIYAQINTDENEIRMNPPIEQLKEWIKYFQKIDKKEDPPPTISCDFQSQNEKKTKLKFQIIEYNKNFIRAHLAEDDNHKSLFLSQSRDFIFVGYCSLSYNENKLSSYNENKSASQTFCAIEKLARFVSDCELYEKMVPLQ